MPLPPLDRYLNRTGLGVGDKKERGGLYLTYAALSSSPWLVHSRTIIDHSIGPPGGEEHTHAAISGRLAFRLIGPLPLLDSVRPPWLDLWRPFRRR